MLHKQYLRKDVGLGKTKGQEPNTRNDFSLPTEQGRDLWCRRRRLVPSVFVTVKRIWIFLADFFYENSRTHVLTLTNWHSGEEGRVFVEDCSHSCRPLTRVRVLLHDKGSEEERPIRRVFPFKSILDEEAIAMD